MANSESKVETEDNPPGTVEGLRYRVTVSSGTNDKNDVSISTIFTIEY